MFWLGIAQPAWLALLEVPSMVSLHRLPARRRSVFPRARTVWMQDSGGFTELHDHGCYRVSPREYVARTRRHMREIGNLAYAAVQDWMCEDVVLQQTGLDIAEHQRRTLWSLLELRQLAPEVPWLPVLQGQVLEDYLRHADMHARAGVDLSAEPLVGLGTVCRRQHTQVAINLIEDLAQLGCQLHGFGLKVTALTATSRLLASADSMAWSLDGRLPHGGRCRPDRDHKQCKNCRDYALLWRARLMDRLTRRAGRPLQLSMWG